MIFLTNVLKTTMSCSFNFEIIIFHFSGQKIVHVVRKLYYFSNRIVLNGVHGIKNQIPVDL